MIVFNGYIISNNTLAIIYKAIQYWKTIKNKKLLSNSYSINETEEFKIKPLSDSDKKCVSLFLAALTEDSEIKTIMNKYDINLKKVLKYLKIKHIKINKLDNNEFYKIFIDEFKDLIEKLKSSSSGKYLYAEDIIYNLNYSFACESDIIKCIFKYFKFENYRMPTLNPAMQEIKKLFKPKTCCTTPIEPIFDIPAISHFKKEFMPSFENSTIKEIKKILNEKYNKDEKIEFDEDFVKNKKKENSMCRVLKFPGTYKIKN